jgi:outer membrane protein assembly factor BamB
VDDGLGGTEELVVAASKDGGVYAVDRATGAPAWTNILAPAVDFAGFGLFNGPVAFSDGKFYAALFNHDNWPTTNDHLYAFDGETGATGWHAQIGTSWSATTVANGVVYVGTLAAKEFYAYDASNGTKLKTFVLPPASELPDNVSGGAAVIDNTLYVPYGIFGGTGGVIAYTLPPQP